MNYRKKEEEEKVCLVLISTVLTCFHYLNFYPYLRGMMGFLQNRIEHTWGEIP